MTITLNGSTGEVFPTWTTATRPSTPSQSQMGFNTTTNAFDVWSGSAWVSLVQSSSNSISLSNLVFNGSSSGSTTVQPAATASGTATIPAGTGTLIETVNNMANNPVTGTPSSSNYLRGDGTWASVSASGQLIRAPQILTSGTSYTTPSNCNTIYVEAVGGGGSGGGGNTGNYAGAGGGGSGAYCAKYFTVTGNTAYTYAIGAGGAAKSGTGNGNNGGNTTFTVSATTITAGGGTGGSGSNTAGNGQQNGGSGGTATNGDMNSKGATGIYGFGLNSSFASLGTGIPSVFGGTYGAGGDAGNNASSAGGSGVIRIWEYT
jgi:hypothetical protein